MGTLPEGTTRARVLLVCYSAAACQQLEAWLQGQPCLEVCSINGRAPEASAEVSQHPAELVIIDRGAKDISINQAVRQIARLLPRCLILTVDPSGYGVHTYRGGHRIGVAENLRAALLHYGFPWDPNAVAIA